MQGVKKPEMEPPVGSKRQEVIFSINKGLEQIILWYEKGGEEETAEGNMAGTESQGLSYVIRGRVIGDKEGRKRYNKRNYQIMWEVRMDKDGTRSPESPRMVLVGAATVTRDARGESVVSVPLLSEYEKRRDLLGLLATIKKLKEQEEGEKKSELLEMAEKAVDQIIDKMEEQDEMKEQSEEQSRAELRVKQVV